MMLRGLVFVILLGMLPLATPAQAARQLVCEGYGHTAQRGNIRLPVDCNDMGKVVAALEDAYGVISRLGRQQHLTDLCWRGVTEARRAPASIAGPAYSTSLLTYCNTGFEYLPLAHEEVIPDLYQRVRFDNFDWQPFFIEMLNHVPADTGGTCDFRIIRQPLTAGLDRQQVASGNATYEDARMVLNLDWHTQEISKSRRPERARLAFDDDGGLSGDMRVFHLWGEEHARGTAIEISVPGFGRENLDGRMFSAPVDEHWTIDVHLENCSGNAVEPTPVDRAAFEGDWSRECPIVSTWVFLDDKTLRKTTVGLGTQVVQDYRYVAISEPVTHGPTATPLAPGDLLVFTEDVSVEGSVWRNTDGKLAQVLSYIKPPQSDLTARMTDAGFMRRDGLQVAHGEGVSETAPPLRRGAC